MITKKVKYTDFLGNEREETLRFHLFEAEFMDFEFGGFMGGKLSDYLQDVMKRANSKENKLERDSGEIDMMQFTRELIERSYGVVSEDGKRFIKSDTQTQEFKQTGAYSTFLMSLYKDENAFMQFVLDLLPQSYRKEAEAEIAKAEAALKFNSRD